MQDFVQVYIYILNKNFWRPYYQIKKVIISQEQKEKKMEKENIRA